MPRRGRVSVAGTSIPELVVKLIDKFIVENRQRYPWLELSRPKVIELAVFYLLSQRNVLDPFLKELGWTDAQIGSIEKDLQVVS